MPEIEFFAVEDEIKELVRWLLDRHCEFIPDLRYESSSFEKIADLPAVQRLAKSTPHFFVLFEDLVESPLKMREVTTADKHFFYIYPQTGGPTLQFYWGRQLKKDESPHLSATSVSHYSWYENSVSGVPNKPQKTFKDHYTEFARAVRVNRRRIKPGKRAFWISREVEELVRTGTVLVGLEGFTVEQILGSTSR